MSTQFYAQIAPHIAQLNQQLNTAKDLLNRPDFEALKRSDPFEEKIRQIRRELTEKTGAQNLTKAGLKMLDILQQTPLGAYLLSLPKVRALFNAELPGSFLFTTNHFLRSQGKELDWLLASYMPLPTGQDVSSPASASLAGKPKKVEGGPLEDIFGLIPANPGRILVGQLKTNKGTFWSTGDLTNPKVPSVLAQLAGQVDLYTADGGFDVSGKENQQEELSLPLIRGEIETGFRTLKPGGAFVLKIFTFFTPQMLAYLLILMRSFNQFFIYKPPTSTPLNSESYFVGLGFKGPALLSQLSEDPSRILETMTQEEAQFLWSHLVGLVQNQIAAIQKFVNHQPVPLPPTPTLLRLDPKDRVKTIRD